LLTPEPTAVPSVVAFCVIDDWFTENRASAMGLITTGAPVGGILFSLVLKALFARYDWQTSMYWLSIIIGCFVLAGSLLVKGRRPAGQPTGGHWNMSHFGDPMFLLFTLCIFSERTLPPTAVASAGLTNENRRQSSSLSCTRSGVRSRSSRP